MGGKRVTKPDAAPREAAVRTEPSKTTTGKKRIAFWVSLAAVVLLVGAAAGVCAYASGYNQVFPGVTLGGKPVSGMSREALTAWVSPDALLRGTITVTAGGLELGRYTQEDLGAQVESDVLVDRVWQIGRESGALGWLKNGWTMVRGALGKKTAVALTISGYDQAVLRKTAEDLAAGFDRAPVDGSYQLTENALFATKPSDGQVLDQAGLVLALSAMEGSSGEVEAPWAAVAAKPLDLKAVSETLNAEPTPARYDIESGQVVEGTVGVFLDPEAADYVLSAAVPGETVQLPAEITPPQMTAAELEALLFRDVLGSYTTNVTGTSVRKGNVRLAGEAVNGTVLNSGDIFDYNAVVGKRTVERGFGAAPTYINGKTVDSVGGGICQVSSTLYMSALLSNLEIVTRANHRYWPGYVPKGMDATVSWGGPEFRFKNDTPYPIRIDIIYDENDQLTVTILGTKTDDTYVKMTYQELSTTPYNTVYEETDTLPYGTEQVQQEGYVGYKIETYRNVYSGDGKLLSSKLEAVSNYSFRDEIILVGTEGKPEGEGGDVSTGGEAQVPGDTPNPDGEENSEDGTFPGEEPGGEVDTGPEDETGGEDGTGPEDGTGSETGTGSEDGTGSEIGTGSEDETGGEAGIGAEAETGSEIDAGPGDGSGGWAGDIPGGDDSGEDAGRETPDFPEGPDFP